MKRQAAATRARDVAVVITASLLVASFGVVAFLINRPSTIAGAGGCASSSGKVASSLVSASYTISSSTTTYYFDSLVNESPSSGVPGLIEYCVMWSGTNPTTETAQAHGFSGNLFDANAPVNAGTHVFSFSRHTGGPTNNIPLDGTTGIQMGTATWSGSAPSVQTFLLHISDTAECTKLYGASADGTCWVDPSAGTTPTPTATGTATPTPTGTATVTPTPTGTVTPTPTPAGVPTPTPTTPRVAPTPTPNGPPPPQK